MLFAAAWVTHYFWLHEYVVDQDYRIVIALGILGTIIFFEIGQVYWPWRNDAMRGEIASIVRGWMSELVAVVSIVALIRLHFWFDSSYRWIASWGVLGLLFVLAARAVLSQILGFLRARGWSQGRIVMVGLNQMAVARQLNHSSWAGLQVVGYVDDCGNDRQAINDFAVPHLDKLEDLPRIITAQSIDLVKEKVRIVPITADLIIEREANRPEAINSLPPVDSNKTSYRIGRQDRSRITVGEYPELNHPGCEKIEPEMAGKVVDENGGLYPYVGSVHEVGKTVSEARADLITALSKYFKKVKLDIRVLSFQVHPEIFQLNGESPAAMILADEFPLQAHGNLFIGTVGVTQWPRVLNQILPGSLTAIMPQAAMMGV